MIKVGDYELIEDLYYWPHGLTWAKPESDGRVRVGMTDLAIKIAGKIRFMRIKSKSTSIDKGKGLAILETGKWVGPVESPVSGTIDEVNTSIRRNLKVLKEDPYGEGWVAVLQPSNPQELQSLIHGEGVVEWYQKEIETRVQKK